MKNIEKIILYKRDIVFYGGIPIESKKKRKNFTYNIDKMINDIENEFINKRK